MSKHTSPLSFLAILLLVLASSACTISGSNKLKKEAEGLEFQVLDYAGSEVAGFRAAIRIHSSLQQAMMVLTDYSQLPHWAWGVRDVRVLELISFNEAYIYQKVAVPLFKDRDLIIHGLTSKDEEARGMRIELNVAADYCSEQTSEICTQVNDSSKVRITRFKGLFLVRELDKNLVEVNWQQHMEPGGYIPAWAMHMMLKRVALQSLGRLKTLVEHKNQDG